MRLTDPWRCKPRLRRLQKDVIDVYQLHNPSMEIVRDGEIFETLGMLKKKGLVRFIGVSVSDPDEGVELIEKNLVDTIQVVYHLLNQKAAERLFPLALENNVGIIVREPLANGILTGKFTPETTFPDTDHRSRTYPPDKLKIALEKVEKLRFLAKDRTMAQAALKFILSQEAVSAVIPGAKRPAQVEDNAGASGEPLSQLELEKVRELLSE